MLLNLAILLLFLLVLILAISKWNIHPFIALIIVAVGLGLSLGMGGEQTIEVLLKGFSETLRWIAVIIILGAFIGEVLQESGGAFRISNSVVKRVKEKNLPWAMGLTGYLVSIPVFVDVAYILLQPITESLAVKSKKPVLYLGLALTAGLTVSHTLIPPTPGPMAVASLLNVDIGRMLAVNLFVALCAMVGGIFFVKIFVNDLWLEYDKKIVDESLVAEQESISDAQSGHVFFDLLPILIPIVLMGFGAFVDFKENNPIHDLMHFMTLPLVAVFMGAFISIYQLKTSDKRSLINRLVEQAIVKSALVIMITGAGGSLGYVIKQSGIQVEIVEVFAAYPFLGMMLPFVVAAILTTSTGSITVSLVGTASMIGPMSDSLSISPEMIAAMIGCGAFCVFHANSSFFWLLNRLHEVPPKILYRSYTLQSLAMGFAGLIGALILYTLGF